MDVDPAVTRFWDDWNSSYRQHTALDETTARLGDAVVDAVRAHAPPHASIVEVGCGTGWLAPRLAALASHYEGWDLSPAAIRLASQHAPTLHFEVRDLQRGESWDRVFDVVVMVDAIAYFTNQDAAVAAVRRLLAPGGHLVLSTVNPIVYRRLSWVGPPGEGQVRQWLTRGELVRLLERHDLKPGETRTILPAGDRGFLRWVNARKLNRPVEALVSARRLVRAKERLGLGQYRLLVAQRA
jgi:2-polyprenyl-3-methyl-5-hydroxy-6-metoxy-1,4-benzoquinol methylase